MNPQEAKRRAAELIEEHLRDGGPEDPQVRHRHGETNWYPDMLTSLAEHELSILARGPDIVVFLDDNGEVTGWRDDGRRGSTSPCIIEREPLRAAVVRELGLPQTTRLGRLRPAELPPLGWTHEAVLFLAPVPAPNQILRVWVAPETLRIIQCLYGPPLPREDRP